MFTEKDRNNRNILISENVVKKSGVNDGGYGVFAGRDYQKGEVVEKCVFLELSNNIETTKIRPELRNYVFQSHLTPGNEIIAFGNGSLFNHHDKPNLETLFNSDKKDKRIMLYSATRPIKRGDELFINYGKGWFERHDIKKNQVSE